MKTNTLISIIYLSFVLIIIAFLGWLIDHKTILTIFSIGIPFFILNGSFLLLKEGEFYKTNEFKFSGLGIGIIIIGAMFKIMHWPLSALIIAFGYIIIISLYLIYMIRNKALSKEKWMKFAFIVTLFAGGYFKLMHWPYNRELTIISLIILSLLVGQFLINRKKQLHNHNLKPAKK